MSNYIINFSSDTITTSGKSIDVERARAVMTAKLQFKAAEIEADEKTIKLDVEDRITSKRSREKLILTELLALGMKEAELGEYNKLLDLAEQIKDSDAKITITSDDLKAFREGFKKSCADPKKPRPDVWRFCPDIFRQLENPKEITEKKKK